MKITLDIPDHTFRQVKAWAALRGMPLQQFVIEALEEKIRPPASPHTKPAEPPWMRGFGALAHLRDETHQVESWIAEAFESMAEETARDSHAQPHPGTGNSSAGMGGL